MPQHECMVKQKIQNKGQVNNLSFSYSKFAVSVCIHAVPYSYIATKDK